MRIILFLLFPLFLGGQSIANYPDNSPYTVDFIKMGIPDIHRRWTASDFDKTFKLLDRIYQMDKYSMPRYQSEYSHDIFAKMTAFDNFDYLLDESVNFGHRVAALEKFRKVPLRILVYYWESKEKKERFGKEVMQCMLLRVYANNQVKKLYDQLKIQLGGRAEYRELMTQGNAINNSLIASVDDILLLLETKYTRYDIDNLEQFAQQIRHLLPQTWSQLPPVWVKAFKKRLKILGKKHPRKEIRLACRKV